MASIFKMVAKTLASFRHPAIWKYVILSLFVALVGFYGFYEAVSYGLDSFKIFDNSWLESFADFTAKAGALIIAWVLFPSVTLAIITIFEESISKVIENKEYKKLENPTPLKLSQEMKLILRNVMWNIIFLPIFFLPVLNLLVYYPLNSYLLGNTVFRFIAARQIGAEKAKDLAEDNNTKVILAGLVLLLITNIPIVNIIAPVFAIILMVHLVHKLIAENN